MRLYRSKRLVGNVVAFLSPVVMRFTGIVAASEKHSRPDLSLTENNRERFSAGGKVLRIIFPIPHDSAVCCYVIKAFPDFISFAVLSAYARLRVGQAVAAVADTQSCH